MRKTPPVTGTWKKRLQEIPAAKAIVDVISEIGRGGSVNSLGVGVGF